MKKISAKIKPILCTAACLCLLIAFFCMAFTSGEEKVSGNERIMLKIWQIDSFEGGKGSRADYLQSVGNDFTKNGGAYISVTALSSEAARLNLSEGNIPDIISYGAFTGSKAIFRGISSGAAAVTAFLLRREIFPILQRKTRS